MYFLYNNWFKTLPVLIIAMSFQVFNIDRETNFPVFLIWLQTLIYLLHQFEEYILPGGFVKFFNKNLLKSNEDAYPLNKVASFWINIPIIFLAFPISAYLGTTIHLSLAIWTAYFSVINSLSHLGIFFKYGYNPGLLVSTLLNIPAGVYCIYYFQSEHIITTNEQITGLIIGLSLQVSIMIYGFKILKPKVKKS